jgi:2'-5' RNA ligase
VRWSDPAGAHITVQFLGATVPARLPALTAALAGVAAGARPLVLRTASLGVFPKPSQARVVWLGLTGDLARLAALQRAVLAATRPLGFAAEIRSFTPHLTLGRVHDGATPAERAAIGTAVAQATPPASAVWPVEELTLMASTLGPRGATYRVVERWRMTSNEQ